VHVMLFGQCVANVKIEGKHTTRKSKLGRRNKSLLWQ
jgi:hypothetical protein